MNFVKRQIFSPIITVFWYSIYLVKYILHSWKFLIIAFSHYYLTRVISEIAYQRESVM